MKLQPPKCPRCGALVRPDVVLFGEPIDGQSYEHLQTELEKGFDIVFSIGALCLAWFAIRLLTGGKRKQPALAPGAFAKKA